jgi:protein-serine/threonine kinase
LSTEGRNFVKGLLNRNPKHRLGATRDAEELKAHPFFADIDWEALHKKNVVPPFKPKLKGELDVSNFDPEFTNALNGNGSLNARAAALASGVNPASTPLSPTMQANFAGFTFTDQSTLDQQFGYKQRDDMERMDEDEKDDVDWDKPAGRGDRMSGVIPSNDHDIFNHGNFDV